MPDNIPEERRDCSALSLLASMGCGFLSDAWRQLQWSGTPKCEFGPPQVAPSCPKPPLRLCQAENQPVTKL